MSPLHALLTSGLVLAAYAGPHGEGLDAYRWRARVLVLSSVTAGDPKLARQAQLLADVQAGLAERDLVVVRLVASGSQGSDGRIVDASVVRRQSGLPPGRFGVALIGKDGGVKLTRADPIQPAELFRIIDAMPMRRDEMKPKAP